MPLYTVFQSGTPIDAAGNQLSATPSIPYTFTKDLDFAGSTGSTVETRYVRPIWTADAPTAVVAVIERHSVLGSTTGMLVHAIGSTPLGSASPVLASTIDHTSAVDVANKGTIIGSTTLTQLAVGDELGWQFTTQGNLSPVGSVSVTLQRI